MRILGLSIIILFIVTTIEPVGYIFEIESTEPKVYAATEKWIDITDEMIREKETFKENLPCNEDVILLAQLIESEAGGEKETGQIAVGNVVLNRVKSPNFPNTLQDVIFQKGQFCVVTRGTINRTPRAKSIDMAKKVLEGEQVVPEDVIFFYNPNTSTDSWIRTRQTVKDIGNHRFAK